MKRTILAALMLGATTTIAGAAGAGITADDPSILYDSGMAEKFQTKREIVDRAQELFGKTAAYETPQTLPDSINQQLVPGNTMPADAPVADVPKAMGDLPTLMDGGSHWVATGNHLVEVTDDANTIVMVVYNALP